MRQLTPAFILEHVEQGRASGQFEAVVLFVDTSGFTPITARLSAHGREGAEVLAGILLAVFEPLVEAVYAHGGFIAGFAGDAFKAIFPGVTLTSYLHALAAAEQIRTQMLNHPTHNTRYGVFNFSVRMSMADGVVSWAVWSGAARTASQSQGYTFFGSAIDQAVQGEDHAEGGELVVTHSFFDALQAVDQGAIAQAEVLTAEATGYVRLLLRSAELPAPRVVEPPAASFPSSASRFYPEPLLNMQPQGEFRPVYTLFINVQTLPAPTADGDFLPHFLQLLNNYGGYLCRIGRIGANDPGGTFLLFWGAPTSHENDLERVLGFLLELRAMLGDAMRAGVTYAVVYAGFIGSALRAEYTCYGSRVNQGARQMVIAKWGQILLDETTARRAQVDYAVNLAGHFVLKGLAGEQPLFDLQGRQAEHVRTGLAHALAFPSEAAFIGRAGEAAQLRAALQPVFAGHFAGFTLVSGEAGIGKSRLVHEVLDALNGPDASRDAQVFLCQTDEILRESLNPLRYFLRRYFNQEAGGGDAANKAAFARKLDGLIAATTETALAAELGRTRSFLGASINLRWPDSLYEQLDPQLRFENVLSALKALLLAESRQRPLILLIEDAHWLDEDSRAFWARLARNVDEYPLAIVATARPLEEAGATPIPAAIIRHEIALSPLTAADIEALARAHLGGAIATELVELLMARAEGNPFFAEQMLLYLQEQALLQEDAQGWRLNDRSTSGSIVPEDVQTVLVARLDRLAQEVKHVVQTAAVLGREFSVQVLSQMLRGDATLAAKVQSAQDAAVWAALSELRYLFRHALLRDAAYEMQLRTHLRQLHALAARSFEQIYDETELAAYYPDLIYHYRTAELPELERHYAVLAAERSAAAYANDDAIAYYSRTLALTPATDHARRYELLLARISLYNLKGDRTRQAADLALLRAAAEQLADNQKRAEAAVRYSQYAEMVAAFDDARQTAEQALTLAQGEPQITARATAQLATVLLNRGDYITARSYCEESIALAKESGLQWEEAAGLHQLGVIVYYLGDYPTAQEQMHAALAIFRALDEPLEVGRVLNSLGIVRSKATEYAHNPYFETALAHWETIGYKRGQAIVAVGIGNLHLAGGAYDTAQAFYSRALTVARETGDPVAESNILFNHGVIATRVGNYAVAIDAYNAANVKYAEIGHRHGIGTVKLALGNAYRNRGELATSRQYFEEGIEVLEALGGRSELGDGYTSLGAVLFGLGLLAEAAAAWQRALELRRNIGRETIAFVPLAWLARVAAEQGDLALARARIDELWTSFATEEINRIYDPGRFYLTCYETLAILQDTRRHDILKTAYALIQKRAAQIQDAEMARSYLHNVSAHRTIVELYERQM